MYAFRLPSSSLTGHVHSSVARADTSSRDNLDSLMDVLDLALYIWAERMWRRAQVPNLDRSRQSPWGPSEHSPNQHAWRTAGVWSTVGGSRLLQRDRDGGAAAGDCGGPPGAGSSYCIGVRQWRCLLRLRRGCLGRPCTRPASSIVTSL